MGSVIIWGLKNTIYFVQPKKLPDVELANIRHQEISYQSCFDICINR